MKLTLPKLPPELAYKAGKYGAYVVLIVSVCAFLTAIGVVVKVTFPPVLP
jgi:hypothetical protein